MNVILFDDPEIRLNLFPFTLTRPVAAIRVGILTIAEKWEKCLNTRTSFKTEAYLEKKFPMIADAENLLINGAVCPDDTLILAINGLPSGHFLVKDTLLIAARNPDASMTASNTIIYAQELTVIDHTWKIFRENGSQLRTDFKRITAGRKSQAINDKHTRVYGEADIFLENDVQLRAAILNAENGPIYLGKNSIVQEGAIIRGAFALGENSQVNMGAKIRGDVTIGPHSKVGGEVSNSVIFGYSNKSHDGFLGNSVLGEWCNIGADTNTSNLRNNYDTVKLWSHAAQDFVQTDLQFCGLMLGDHSKCAINTMFNTATVVDVCSNVFGAGFPQKYIPSFSWGGPGGLTTYALDKALYTSGRVMARRDVVMNEMEKEILIYVFQLTANARVWENK